MCTHDMVCCSFQLTFKHGTRLIKQNKNSVFLFWENKRLFHYNECSRWHSSLIDFILFFRFYDIKYTFYRSKWVISNQTHFLYSAVDLIQITGLSFSTILPLSNWRKCEGYSVAMTFKMSSVWLGRNITVNSRYGM